MPGRLSRSPARPPPGCNGACRPPPVTALHYQTAKSKPEQKKRSSASKRSSKRSRKHLKKGGIWRKKKQIATDAEKIRVNVYTHNKEQLRLHGNAWQLWRWCHAEWLLPLDIKITKLAEKYERENIPTVELIARMNREVIACHQHHNPHKGKPKKERPPPVARGCSRVFGKGGHGSPDVWPPAGRKGCIPGTSTSKAQPPKPPPPKNKDGLESKAKGSLPSTVSHMNSDNNQTARCQESPRKS